MNPHPLLDPSIPELRRSIKEKTEALHAKAKELESKIPNAKDNEPQYQFNQTALREVIQSYAKAKVGTHPWLKSPLDLAIFLQSFHTDIAKEVYEMAYGECSLCQQYEILDAVMLLSINYGVDAEATAKVPDDFLRDARFIAAFTPITTAAYPEFDQALEPFVDRFHKIALTQANPKEKVAEGSPTEKALFMAFADFFKALIAKPELLPDPLRYVMMSYFSLADRFAPGVSNEDRITYFSGFLMTRFFIPRFSLDTRHNPNSPRYPNLQFFVANNVSNQLQKLASTPDKAARYTDSGRHLVRDMIQALSMQDPTMKETLRLCDCWHGLKPTQSLGLLSPRRSKPTLAISEIQMPTLEQLNKRLASLAKGRSKEMKILEPSVQALKRAVLDNMLHAAVFWTRFFYERPASMYTRVSGSEAAAAKIHELAIQVLQDKSKTKNLAFMAALCESTTLPSCAELFFFIQQRLGCRVETVMDELGVMGTEVLHPRAQFLKAFEELMQEEIESANIAKL